MAKLFIRYALWFLLLIPAQAIVFNHAILFNVAVPLVFLYLIVSLPVTINTNLSTLFGFIVGFVLDIFCDTPGVNALCCTVLAFIRKPIFHLYVSFDDDLAGRVPSTQSMVQTTYMKYLLTMAAIYCTMLFMVEAFQLSNFKLMTFRIIASTIYTFILIYALNLVTHGRHEQH
ncbi:MAG: rod shape-determining protein MreD [Muribaculaceae bacterium]|nr:rod shape-determining protein MreD [Muribaculaceae bacterium]